MTSSGNHLIERLPNGVQMRFLARCEPYELRPSAELTERGVAFTHAYFPNTGSISLVVDVDRYPPLEVGVVGRESMLGSELLLGVVTSPLRSMVQVAGSCWRIDVRSLRQAMADMPTLQALLQRNLMVRVRQHQALASASTGPGH